MMHGQKNIKLFPYKVHRSSNGFQTSFQLSFSAKVHLSTSSSCKTD